MMVKCITQFENIHFLELMAKYIKKGNVENHSEFGIIQNMDQTLLKLFEKSCQLSNLSQWLNVFLKICTNGGVRMNDKTISSALKICHSLVTQKEKEKEKENLKEYTKCIQMLKKYA